jgi:hypothetical protein
VSLDVMLMETAVEVKHVSITNAKTLVKLIPVDPMQYALFQINEQAALVNPEWLQAQQRKLGALDHLPFHVQKIVTV